MSDVTRLLEAADRGDRQAAGRIEATAAASVLARVGHLDRRQSQCRHARRGMRSTTRSDQLRDSTYMGSDTTRREAERTVWEIGRFHVRSASCTSRLMLDCRLQCKSGGSLRFGFGSVTTRRTRPRRDTRPGVDERAAFQERECTWHRRQVYGRERISRPAPILVGFVVGFAPDTTTRNVSNPAAKSPVVGLVGFFGGGSEPEHRPAGTTSSDL